MRDDINVRKALIAAAKAFLTTGDTLNTRFGVKTGQPTIDASCIGWENRAFDTANKELWCSVFYRPNLPVSRTIGACGQDQYTGFMQIDFNVPPDTGEEVLMSWEQKARFYFFHGQSFQHGGQNVLVTSSGMSQGRHVENNFRKSLTVAFRADVRKNNQI